MGSWSRWALLLSCFAGLAYAFYVYSLSPEVVPLHYGPSGLPDRWGKPGQLLMVHLGLIGFGTALFLALPSLLQRLPRSLVNLPNKEYWLAPERRAQTSEKLVVWSCTFGTALNVLAILMQALLSSGMKGPSALPSVVALGFALFAVGACFWLVRAFELPVDQGRPD